MIKASIGFVSLAALSLCSTILPSEIASAEPPRLRATVLLKAPGNEAPHANTMPRPIEFWNLPGRSSPAFALRGARQTEIVDVQGNVVPYEGQIPSYDDGGMRFSQTEPWSGTKFGWQLNVRGLWRLTSGATQYAPVPGSTEGRSSSLWHVSILPRRKLAIASKEAGSPQVVEDNGFRPWAEVDPTLPALPPIAQIYDAPSLAATILVTQEAKPGCPVLCDGRVRILVLTDDNKVFFVDELPWRSNGAAGVFDAFGSHQAIYMGFEELLAISKRKDGEGFSSTVLNEANSLLAPRWYFESHLFGQLLSFGMTGGLFDFDTHWLRLGRDGFDVIKGSPVALAQPPFQGDISFFAKDLPTLHRTVIRAPDGLYLYDGETMMPVAGSGPDVLGPQASIFQIFDLPSIGHVLVTGKSGVFELKTDGLHNTLGGLV